MFVKDLVLVFIMFIKLVLILMWNLVFLVIEHVKIIISDGLYCTRKAVYLTLFLGRMGTRHQSPVRNFHLSHRKNPLGSRTLICDSSVKGYSGKPHNQRDNPVASNIHYWYPAGVSQSNFDTGIQLDAVK